MVKSCAILLLVAACSVHANVTSTQKEIASAYLDIAIDMISKAKSKIPTHGDCPKKPLDCAEVLDMGHDKSGVYEIWPVSRMTEGKRLHVYCDMKTNGGGWTVIQRRGDFHKPKDYFYRDWKSYKEGFGELKKDFWLGNDNIFALTNQKLYSIRFDLKDFQGNKTYAFYDNFWIDDEYHNYTLHISKYSGNAGNSMAFSNNMPFSTIDRKNDHWTEGNCTQFHKGAWWYDECAYANLNGLYLKGNVSSRAGIFWDEWKRWESLARTEMKIRPKHFRHSL